MDCKRCGADTPNAYIAKRVERGLAAICQDCASRRRNTLRTHYGICKPHQGEFDEYDNPLGKTGALYLAGKRLCGYRDCVNPEHIES